MRSKAREDGRAVKFMLRDLREGENPWNGTRKVVSSSVMIIQLFTPKCVAREKAVIQPPGSASAAVTTWEQPIVRDLV